MDGEDVRVGERGQRPRLALEASEALRVARDLFRKYLDRDIAAEALVVGPVDLAHAPLAEFLGDVVVGEDRAEHVKPRAALPVDEPFRGSRRIEDCRGASPARD
jgi:hypothetical protein